MACKYILHGHEFNSEIELDAFLLGKEKYYSKYKDLIFNKISEEQAEVNESIESIKNRTKQVVVNKIDFTEDGEALINTKKPYIGVRKFINLAEKGDGSRVIAEFIDENYWNNRTKMWTNDGSGRDVSTVFDGTNNGVFTEDEINIIFNGQDPTYLSLQEASQWKQVIIDKWHYQGTAGTALHAVMEQLYIKDINETYNYELYPDPDKFYDYLISNKQTSDYKNLSDADLKSMSNIAFKIHGDIISKIGMGPDLQFYPELGISARMSNVPNKPELDKIHQLYGIVDLLVIDKKGNSYIFDYKTSPKEYQNYNSAKKLEFNYQLAFYRQILKTYGFTVGSNNVEECIIPIQMENFGLDNTDEIQDACQSNSYKKEEAKFSYKSLSYNGIENITSDIKSNNSIYPVINDYLPAYNIDRKLVAGDAITETNKITSIITPTIYKKEHKTKEQLNKELEDAGAYIPKNGNYTYVVDGQTVTVPENAPNAKIKFFNIINAKYVSKENVKNITDVCLEALKTGITNNNSEIAEIIKQFNKGKTTGVDSNWFMDTLGRYCDQKYSIIPCEAAATLGIIFVQNKYNKMVDILKISTLDLKRQHFLNKKADRSNLTYAFQDDIVEDSKSDSLMLKATTGNIEMMETLAFINSIKDQLQDNIIGKIQVINPYRGIGETATNKELQYTWNKILNLAKQNTKELDDIEDNISNGNLKMATAAEVAINDFEDAMDTQDGRYAFSFYNKKNLKDVRNAMNDAEDNTTKLRLLKQLIDYLSKPYGDKVQSTINISDQNNLNTKILNEALLAYAELSGVDYRQQLADHDKFFEYKSIGKIFTKGLSGTMIDNPGQQQSPVLNTMTEQLTNAYQNVRESMQPKIAEIRQRVEKLKKAKGYSYAQSRVIGNEASIFKNMTEINSSGDYVFKNPKTANDLSVDEKEFLQYTLEKINKNRYPTEDIESMQDNNDIRFFRVPLAKGNFASDVAVRGMWTSLKQRCVDLMPSNALARLKEQTEGLFGPDQQSQKSHNLFEMNNVFTNGEDDKNREAALIANGADYYEHNLETLLLEHDFAYVSKQHIDEVMPLIRAAVTYLAVRGTDTNISLDTDITYAQKYIKTAIKNEQYFDNIDEQKTLAVANKIKAAASFCSLAFSPVQGIYQGLQAVWQDIGLIIRKPDGSQAFTWHNFLQAFKYVYKDLFHYSDTPTKCQLINELMGVNDMDMNSYTDRIKSDKTGFLNIYNLAYKFSSRPDYYNRMSIIVAKMIADGSWDAYSVVNGKLVYDQSKDGRYSDFINKVNVNSEKYLNQQALYYANLNQFKKEGRNVDNGLPQAYTTKEVESMKSLGDLIYGYYSHEKKSLVQYTFVGSMFMQMKTYWSGKKNQYLQPGGIKVRGNWQQYEENGKKYYYQVNENGIAQVDLPPVTEDQLKDTDIRVPFIQWKGLWQEGVFMTMADVWKHAYLDTGKGNILKGFINYAPEMYKKLSDKNIDESLRKVYRANMAQLMYELVTLFLVSTVLSGMLLGPWADRLAKEARESNTVSDGLYASAARILNMSVDNSAMDYNFFSSIGSPAFQWTPFSFETAGKLVKNVLTTTLGDRTVYGGIINTFSATKQFKPLLQTLGPITEPSDE